MTPDERAEMRRVLRENLGRVIRELLITPLEEACVARPTSEVDRELLAIGRDVLADILGKADELVGAEHP